MLTLRHAHADVRYLFDRSYEAVHARIREVLGVEAALCFAGTEGRKVERLWYIAREGETISYHRATEAEKDEATDLLAEMQATLLPQLKANAELAPIAELLFRIPSEDSILLTRSADGRLAITLAQWGCQSAIGNRHSDPFSIAVQRPKQDHTAVTAWATYSDGSVYARQPLRFQYKDLSKDLITNDKGHLYLGMLKNGVEFGLSGGAASDVPQSFEVRAGQEIYEVVLPYRVLLTIWVQDQNGQPMPGTVVEVTHGPYTARHTADAAGIMQVPQLALFQGPLTLTEVGQESNCQNYELARAETAEITFLVQRNEEVEEDIPMPPPVQVNLVNHKNQPMPEVPLDFNFGKALQTHVTDAHGKCHLDTDLFAPKQKTRVTIRVPRSGGGERIHRKTITHQQGRTEYTLKLHSRRWLWLLLLLPLLLLFIPFEKTLDIQVIDTDSGQPVPGIPVELAYTHHALYSQGNLLLADNHRLRDTANNEGRVQFRGLRTTVYAWVFKHRTSVRLSAHSDCYTTGEGISIGLHTLREGRTEILPASPIKIILDFVVVDDEDGQPLPNAKVVVLTEINGYFYTDTLLTDAAGRVIAPNCPRCGKLVQARATADGYHPDSLKSAPIADIAGGNADSTRQLRLKPIEATITFFVINCNNGEPLPGAIATIYLSKGDGSDKDKKVYSNINGVGKGQYEKAHVIRRLKIKLSKPYFRDTLWDKGLNVEDFIMLPDSARTVCLRPEDQTYTFENVDSLTRRPLSGVANVVRIRRGGEEIRVDTFFSNKNGKFSVPGLQVGDKVSILANLNPTHEPNGYTVANTDFTDLLKDSKRRIIPLKHREIELRFRTIDPDADTLVSNATLTVIVDGRRVNPLSSGDGTFIVKGGYYSVVTIVAEKTGYMRNDTKIINKAFGILRDAPQTDRDIPMKGYTKSKITVTIRNHNSKPDEAFKLIVNGLTIGTFHHVLSVEELSSFDVEVFNEKDNFIELVLTNGNDSDTGERIEIHPGGYAIEYSGNDISYSFVFNPQKRVFKRT